MEHYLGKKPSRHHPAIASLVCPCSRATCGGNYVDSVQITMAEDCIQYRTTRRHRRCPHDIIKPPAQHKRRVEEPSLLLKSREGKRFSQSCSLPEDLAKTTARGHPRAAVQHRVRGAPRGGPATPATTDRFSASSTSWTLGGRSPFCAPAARTSCASPGSCRHL